MCGNSSKWTRPRLYAGINRVLLPVTARNFFDDMILRTRPGNLTKPAALLNAEKKD